MADIPNFGSLGSIGNILQGGGAGNFLASFNAFFGKLQAMDQLQWFGLITIGFGIINIILPVAFILHDMSQRARMGRGR
jgi:hypothetical protein